MSNSDTWTALFTDTMWEEPPGLLSCQRASCTVYPHSNHKLGPLLLWKCFAEGSVVRNSYHSSVAQTNCNMAAPFLTKEDVDQLKAYVKGTGGQNMSESTILLHATHSNLQAKFFEIRLDKHVRSSAQHNSNVLFGDQTTFDVEITSMFTDTQIDRMRTTLILNLLLSDDDRVS